MAYRALTFNQKKRRYISSVNENSNLLLVSTRSLWGRRFGNTRFGLSVKKYNELRAIPNPFGKSWAYTLYSAGNDTTYRFAKYQEYFRYTNRSAGVGYARYTIVLFDRDEALLNRAEAYVMKKQYDKALKDLNIYLSKKTRNFDASTDKLTQSMITSKFTVSANELTPHYSLDDTQKSLVKAILEFKKWEYYHEGLRWFDVRRFNIEIKHKFKDSPDMVLRKDDPRRQLQIPGIAIAQGGIKKIQDKIILL